MKRFLTLIPVLALALVPAANGAIVSSGVQNIVLPQSFFTGVYVNIITHVSSATLPSDFDTAPWIGFDLGGIDISNGDTLRPVITSISQVVNLTTSDSVGSASNLTAGANFSDTHTGPAQGQFQVLTVSYLGFAFSPTVGAPVQYGWAKITIDNTSTGTLHEWAYETTPGTTIQVGAGAVPEPTAPLLTLLAARALTLRRRRARRHRA
jgi:hypothetical protein